jgi:tape measure domain-containing protein
MADANIIVKIVDQTRGGIGSVVNQVDQLNGSATRATGGFNGLQRAIGAVAAAVSVREFVQFGSEVQNIQNRLALINPELGNTAENFARIVQIANETFQPLSAVSDLYQKVARSADQYNLSAEQVGVVTTTFTNLLRIAGADANTASGAILQFGQALGSGVLNGQEFVAVVEATAGEILPLLAAELGVSVGQLKELSSEGRITGEVLVNALAAGADNVSNRVGNMGVTIGGALVVLQNKFLELGTTATPVFDAVAQGILFIADNLDTVVTVAGVFFAAFAVKKIVDISVAIGTLAKGILALNATMLTNPIGLAIAAISAAVILLISQWDNLSSVAESAFRAIEVAGLTLNKWFIQFLDFVVNDVVNGFLNMGRRAGNVLSALAAAAADPLNAFEVFRAELARGEEQIQANQLVTVDFSGRIEELDRRIAEASSTTDENTGALGNNENQTDSLTGSTDDLASATDDATRSTDNHTGALGDNAQAARLAAREAEALRIAIETGTRAVNESIRAYDNETRAMGLSEQQREIMQRVIQEEQRYREALGETMEQLTEEQIRQIYELGDLQELYTADFINLSDQQIDAIIEGTRAREQATIDRTKAMEAERAASQALSDFTRDTERLNRSYYEATTSRSQQLTDEMNDYIRRAREQNRSNNADTQRAIQEYERQINEQRRKDHDDLMRDYENDLRDFRSEYSAIYDDIYGVLEDWTGKSRSELDRYNQYAKLLFGVDLLGSFNGFVDNSLMSMAGWNTQASNQMGVFANNAANYTNAAGEYIGNNVFGPNGSAQRGVGGFVNYSLNAFGANGGGLLGAVMSLFGGLGNSLNGLFGGIFGGIGNGLKGFGNLLGNVFGGVADFGSNLIGGIIDFGGSIIGAFTDMFFADGGYIRPGSMGIVGDAGPEIVRGPANVTSTADTASMMGRGSNVNVAFTINAVDARGVDELLIERKALIADIMRDAVASSGRGLR